MPTRGEISMTTISKAVALFGTEEPVAPVRTLRAGPLTAELKAGNLRHIRYEGIEALRAVAFLVRDRNWATYAPTLENLKVGQGGSDFLVSYDAVCSDQAQRLRYSARITARSDGSLRFEASGAAETDFVTNRAGFVVLHPLEGVAGRPVRVTHTDGKWEEAEFPRLISPGQPFFDIRALAHEVLPGVLATCTMQGDAYEMEDHRNWTDASYKTYIRPLSKPRPFTLRAGERFAQSVELTFEGSAGRASRATSDEIVVRLGGPAGAMPRIGLFIPPDETDGCLEAADLLAPVAPQFLVGHLDLRDRRTADALHRVQTLAEALGASVTLEIVLAGARRPGEELAEAASVAGAAGLRPEAVIASPHEYLKSWQPNETWPDVPPLEEIYGAAREAFPDSRIGGGMLAYFTELNRKRPPIAHCDFITHTTCPIVHDADDRSVMESLEALPWIAESVRAMSGGRPYRIGPSTIGMRLNPYGAGPVDNPDNRRLAMAWNDPRQRGLFGAAWNLGYAARIAEAGVEALALSAPVGAFGIAYRQTGFPQPWFEAKGQGVFPVYHVVRGLAQAAGAPHLETRSSRPGAVQALAWRHGERTTLWLANLTGEPQAVTIGGLRASSARLARLDLDRFVAAAAGPDGLATASAESPAERQELGPYAVLRLESDG
jgi:hypothetical protein